MTNLMTERLHYLLEDGLDVEFGCSGDGSVMAVRIVGKHEGTGDYDVTMTFMGHGVLYRECLDEILGDAGLECHGVLQDGAFTEYYYSR